MSNEKIWLSSPHMGGGEQKYIAQAFDTNWIAPLGPNVTGFENDLQNYLQQDVYVAALSSGTAALHLALILLGVKYGDDVICQSMTFSASANPIVYQGANPIFVDSEPSTWGICPNALEDAIKNRLKVNKKPKAIIAVHLYGMPFNVDSVKYIANKYEIPLIEDSAEALGSSYKSRKCGTFGDISILSFNGNKVITTSGGGALVCHKIAQKEKAVFLSTQARDNAPHYQHSEIGYNYRMSNVCAAIGRGQMEVIDAHIIKRREMHAFYEDLFKEIPNVNLFSEPDSNYYSNHWLSAIIINSNDTSKNRTALYKHLESYNIESRPLWKPMHLQPVFKDAMYFGGKLSENLFEKGLCLPSGSNLNNEQKQKIKKSIEKFVF